VRFAELNPNNKIKYVLLRLHLYGLMGGVRGLYLSMHGKNAWGVKHDKK
jgi:hypothetical protein